MSDHDKIRDFIIRAKGRFNLLALFGGICGGFFLAAAGMLLIAAGYVVAGYAVERKYLIVPFFAGAAFAVAWFVFSKLDESKAAEQADEHFDLHDSLTSVREFHQAGKDDGIYDLQARYTAKSLEKKDISSIKYRWPVKWLTIAAAVLILAIGLCTLDNSLAVQQRIDEEKLTAERSDEIAKYLKKQYEDLEKKLDKKQKELLKKSGLKKKIDDFDKTKDRKEALRKLGKIEKQFRQLSAQAASHKDQKFLKRLAKKMAKAKQTKKLAAELSAGNYAKAAKTLKEFKADSQKHKKKSDEEIAEMLKKLARAMEQADDMEARQGDVEKAARQFTKSAKDLDCDSEQCDGMFQECDFDLDEMAEEMEGFGQKMEFAEQMQQMSEMLGECQNCMMGMGNKPGMGQCKKPGMGMGQGKKPGPGIGTASAGNKRKGGDKADKRGKTTRIRGRKGKGPSSISVSEASHGSGVSSRPGDVKKADAFKSQVESFVSREDVPENLKGGVKKYFEIIHEANTDIKEQP